MSVSIFSKCGTCQRASVLYRANPPPTWSWMPPDAIRSSVRVAISSAPLVPRTCWRSNHVSTIGCGNFGAGPNPPQV